MKKKILALSLVIALLAIAVVGGSLAWFTDEDEVENTFTIGSVKIEIWENGEVADGTEEMGQLLPIVNTTPSEDENYIDKVVEVKNTGKNPAYVRTHIAIPAQLVGYLELDRKEDNWTYVGSSEATVGGVSYVVVSYDYNYELAVDETTDVLLRGVYLGSQVDLKDDPSTPETEDLVFCKKNDDGTYTYSGFAAYTGSGAVIQGVNVLVASQAIQSQGFADATTALNSGFGTNTNPWQ